MCDEAEDAGDCQKAQKKLEKKHDSGAADLEKVTDYAEEEEIRSDNIKTAINLIDDRYSKEIQAKVERQRELAKVVINKADVELIMNEMEVPKNIAEQTLRENGGDVVNALIQMTS